MKFTGTLIEDLMATVERAEQKTQSDGGLIFGATPGEPLVVAASVAEPMFVGTSFAETWFASVQENADYDSKLIGVA